MTTGRSEGVETRSKKIITKRIDKDMPLSRFIDRKLDDGVGYSSCVQLWPFPMGSGTIVAQPATLSDYAGVPEE